MTSLFNGCATVGKRFFNGFPTVQPSMQICSCNALMHIHMHFVCTHTQAIDLELALAIAAEGSGHDVSNSEDLFIIDERDPLVQAMLESDAVATSNGDGDTASLSNTTSGRAALQVSANLIPFDSLRLSCLLA
jgi:hypothetical protein